ncbi:hypothetical protein GWK47_036239 [Chionoecetes opilio]|uniref:Uncharacterized protein n=1 Tax=Chionoecetes opilio TaxID=41210 RepID=A0A8J5CN40_CHIOP|nr:hypothetical protein GWK47_036239 [Chionoecetes opilio]
MFSANEFTCRGTCYAESTKLLHLPPSLLRYLKYAKALSSRACLSSPSAYLAPPTSTPVTRQGGVKGPLIGSQGMFLGRSHLQHLIGSPTWSLLPLMGRWGWAWWVGAAWLLALPHAHTFTLDAYFKDRVMPPFVPIITTFPKTGHYNSEGTRRALPRHHYSDTSRRRRRRLGLRFNMKFAHEGERRKSECCPPPRRGRWALAVQRGHEMSGLGSSRGRSEGDAEAQERGRHAALRHWCPSGRGGCQALGWLGGDGVQHNTAHSHAYIHVHTYTRAP